MGALVEREPPVATATIAYVEVQAGLTRKRRDRELSRADYERTREQFERDWGAYLRVDLAEPVLALARDLVGRHPLRAADAIHLASALRLQATVEEAVRFVAADERLLRAAGAEGLSTLNVDTAPA
jgi:predicted nucleic acid-binding protein